MVDGGVGQRGHVEIVPGRRAAVRVVAARVAAGQRREAAVGRLGEEVEHVGVGDVAGGRLGAGWRLETWVSDDGRSEEPGCLP